MLPLVSHSDRDALPQQQQKERAANILGFCLLFVSFDSANLLSYSLVACAFRYVHVLSLRVHLRSFQLLTSLLFHPLTVNEASNSHVTHRMDAFFLEISCS